MSRLIRTPYQGFVRIPPKKIEYDPPKQQQEVAVLDEQHPDRPSPASNSNLRFGANTRINSQEIDRILRLSQLHTEPDKAPNDLQNDIGMNIDGTSTHFDVVNRAFELLAEHDNNLPETQRESVQHGLLDMKQTELANLSGDEDDEYDPLELLDVEALIERLEQDLEPIDRPAVDRTTWNSQMALSHIQITEQVEEPYDAELESLKSNIFEIVDGIVALRVDAS